MVSCLVGWLVKLLTLGLKVSVSRRSILRTAVWTTPVVSLAAATPAFASSTATTPTPMHVKVWKEPGNGKFPHKGSFISFSVETAPYVGAVTINGVAASLVFVASRGMHAWGIENQQTSETPMLVEVTTTDGVVHNLGTLMFLPWPAAN